MLFVNVFFAHRQFNDPAADFKEQMNLLAYRLMHNPHLPETTAQSPPSAGRCSPCASGDGEAHTLVLLSKLYKEFNIEKPSKGRSPVQRCIICNVPTSWACATCSTAAFQLVPVHPHHLRGGGKKGGGGRTCSCEEAHRAAPTRRHAKPARARRARTQAAEEEVEDEDDDEEL